MDQTLKRRKPIRADAIEATGLSYSDNTGYLPISDYITIPQTKIGTNVKCEIKGHLALEGTSGKCRHSIILRKTEGILDVDIDETETPYGHNDNSGGNIHVDLDFIIPLTLYDKNITDNLLPVGQRYWSLRLYGKKLDTDGVSVTLTRCWIEITERV